MARITLNNPGDRRGHYDLGPSGRQVYHTEGWWNFLNSGDSLPQTKTSQGAQYQAALNAIRKRKVQGGLGGSVRKPRKPSLQGQYEQAVLKHTQDVTGGTSPGY